MKTAVITVGYIDENVYFFYDEDTRKGIVIDPGDGAENLINFIDKNNLRIKGIFLTHGHWDHIGAVEALKQHIGCKVYASREEQQLLLSNAAINHSASATGKSIEIKADVLLKDNDEIAVANEVIRAIHTPGHTPGGMCYYAETSKVLFSGDTLFFEDVGRYDLPLGDGRALFSSIQEKLFVLPDDVVVFPGHGPKTLIFNEKNFNPYMRGSLTGDI